MSIVDPSTTLEQLIQRTKAERARYRDEWHFTCPKCGKESSPRNPHCSMSERGWFCFVCGQGGSLRALAQEILGAGDYQPSPKREKPKRYRMPQWMRQPNAFLERYTRRSDRFTHWMAYKPLSAATIEQAQLGVGPLPGKPGGCGHDRLVVPVFNHGLLVGLRGRRLNCTCQAKWIPASGTPLTLLPLYNLHESAKPGCTLWLVENPIDALLLAQHTDYGAAATFSTSYWKPEWALEIKALQPESVIVALDNDLVGNGGANRRAEFIAEWRKTHQHVPEPRAPKIANELNRIGLKAIIFDWQDAEYKADIGTLILEEFT